MVLKIKDPTAIIRAASAILFALWAAELALRERLSCSALEASPRRPNHPTTQARLTTDALNLARQEFVANHRPRVILRYIQGPFENEEGRQFIWVTFVNIGANTATIEAFGADLAKRFPDTDDWAVPGLDAGPKEISPIVLTCGQRHVFTVTAREVPETELELQIFRETTTQDYQLCAVGMIRYTDAVGVARDTGFFRMLRGERFIISEHDSEMEYQD